MGANRTIPLTVQRSFKELLKQCISITEEHPNIKLAYDLKEFTINLEENTSGTSFYFRIKNPHLEQSTPPFAFAQFFRYPKSEDILSEMTGNVRIDTVINSINGWLQIIDSFNDFSGNPESISEKYYADNYFAEWKFVDEDADIVPFNESQQIRILKMIGHIKQDLLSYPELNDEIKEIISDAEMLEDNIQRLPKNKALKYMSRVAAKVTIQGPKLMKYLFEKVKDEALKFLIKQIFEEGMSTITRLLHHLP